MAEVKKKMKTAGYIIEGIAVCKMHGHNRQKIGDILMTETRYLFDLQNYWVDGSGATKDVMDLILADRGQVYGRGYYISLNPTDSMEV